MICSDCVFHSVYRDHSASVDVCLLSLKRDLIEDIKRASYASSINSCPHHINFSHLREHFIYSDNDCDIII